MVRSRQQGTARWRRRLRTQARRQAAQPHEQSAGIRSRERQLPQPAQPAQRRRHRPAASPRKKLALRETMAMPPPTCKQQNASHGQSPTGCQAQSGFAWPARPQRQSLLADRVHLAVQPESQRRIAQHQQERQNGLLNKRRPRIVCQPGRCTMCQRPGQKEIDDGDKKLPDRRATGRRQTQVRSFTPPGRSLTAGRNWPRAGVPAISPGTPPFQMFRQIRICQPNRFATRVNLPYRTARFCGTSAGARPPAHRWAWPSTRPDAFLSTLPSNPVPAS